MKYLFPFSLFPLALSLFSLNTVAQPIIRDIQTSTPEPRIQEAQAQPRAITPLKAPPKPLRFAVAELRENKALTEQVLLLAIEQKNPVAIEKAVNIYRTFADHDPLLLLFAQGQFAKLQGKTDQAVKYYRELIALEPELDAVRLELAMALFEDQQNDAAKAQFEQLRSRTGLPNSIKQHIHAYLEALQKREAWQINLSAHYLREKNVNNASNAPYIDNTVIKGLQKNPSMLPQKAHGMSYQLDISRQINVKHQHYLHIENNLNGKWFWDNHQYDDIFNRTLVGYAYKNASQEWQVLPFYQRQWYGKQRYNKSMGLRLEHRYWLTPSVQLTSVLEQGHHRYHDNPSLNGKNQLFSQTLFWQQQPTQFFHMGIDINRTKTAEKQYSNLQKTLRLGWGRSWQWGISSRVNVSISQRQYRDEAKLSGWLPLGKVREDKIYQAQLTLWKRDWYLWQITPKLQLSWKTQQSNIPSLYQYQEKNVNVIFEKRF
ncbi:surface lipoprotein assembly modifier [Pasteurella sp. PK-2025]|uniref:surface lipoprotein assembly modifier n=1 Tax=Pasteurella sp. PK-2025 TaxID=3413133 RepID=UPI003C70C27F